jgi:hypothetical protein
MYCSGDADARLPIPLRGNKCPLKAAHSTSAPGQVSIAPCRAVQIPYVTAKFFIERSLATHKFTEVTDLLVIRIL